MQHGAVADPENALYLEHAVDKGESVGFIPLPTKRSIGHQKGGGKGVCLALMGFLLAGVGDIIVRQMKNQMTELMGGGEYPPFNRDAIPSVDDYRRAAVGSSDREAKEVMGRNLLLANLDAPRLEQPADVVNWLLRV